MNKNILTYVGVIVGGLAGIAQLLTYFNFPADTLLGKFALVSSATAPLPITVIAVILAAFIGFLLGKGRFSSHKHLVIRSAVYGVNGHVFDVTEKLNSLIEDNSLRVLIGNHLAGDPQYGIPKHADVYYTYGTSERRAAVPENSILEIPRSTDAEHYPAAYAQGAACRRGWTLGAKRQEKRNAIKRVP